MKEADTGICLFRHWYIILQNDIYEIYILHIRYTSL